jgi:hypothetical protein
VFWTGSNTPGSIGDRYLPQNSRFVGKIEQIKQSSLDEHPASFASAKLAIFLPFAGDLGVSRPGLEPGT